MATRHAPQIPVGDGAGGADVAVQRQWRMRARLSSVADAAEAMLEDAGFDRAPWLAVAFAGGIAAWFVLPFPTMWILLAASLICVAAMTLGAWRGQENRVVLSRSVVAICVVVALGVGIIWARSAAVGAQPIEHPKVLNITGYVLERQDQPAENRIRLLLAIRDADAGMARKIRVNLDGTQGGQRVTEGAIVRLRARLMPPAPPMLPGSYDFARRAWFDGLAATGSAMGPVEILKPSRHGEPLARIQRGLAAHVHEEMGEGSAASIAAALASGDRGSISHADEAAMRDAGLTHLLSISGLHVSAIVAAGYFLTLKLLGLFQGIALRARLPVVAAASGAAVGIAYTLLTGAQVPTVRSCVGAVLVLIALAMGREPLSMRLVAVAAVFVLLLWPESLVGPSFQMSFAAVIAIISLHNAPAVRRFLAPREEPWWQRILRNGTMLLVTGLVIDIALMPIVLFHFHRAGVYGAFANVVAIPLVTFAAMPLIGLALAFDLLGLGAPFWWLAEKSLELLLFIAHGTASQPGAVKLMPQMGDWTFALFVAGGLWLALWQGRLRWFAAAPILLATAMLLATPVPDILVSRDGKHVGITGEGDRLVSLRDSKSSYARDNLLELAGTEGEILPMAKWRGAECSRDFCVVPLDRGGRSWTMLIARNRELVEERALAAACEQVDIVIADRWLPAACKPRWLKADGRFLLDSGGLAIYLNDRKIVSVAQSQGEHGWWRAAQQRD